MSDRNVISTLTEGCWSFIALFSLLLIGFAAQAQENVVLRESFAGNISFTATGNSLRNSDDECTPLNSSAAQITLPANSSITAAYLFWSGSGSPDNQVTLQTPSGSAAVTADKVYTAQADSGAAYFSAKADVTSRMSSSTSATYRVSRLSFSNDYNTYCSSGGAYGGWALLVIYENANEPLRVVNLFDGFQVFWGSSITLSPSNFVIADSPSSKGGRHAHITWEGDNGNSQSRNNVTERLAFNGYTLSDAGNPSNNQFNSYSNTYGGSTSGVDVDIYNIDNYLTAGARSVTTTYSTGQDQVFLTAEVISVPNQPVSDLELAVSGPATLDAGAVAEYTFTVHNNGPLEEPTGGTLSMPLNGMGLYGYSGTNWNCAEQSGSVLCTYTGNIADGADAPSLVIRLDSSAVATGTYSSSATIAADNFDHHSGNNTVTVSTQIDSARYLLSKTADDLTGGEVRSGDSLRYTIALTNSSGAAISNVQITDAIPADISNYHVVSVPAGASYNSNGSQLVVSSLTVAAGDTASIVLDAELVNPLSDGTVVTNKVAATVSGSLYAASASVTVNSAVITAGNKPLYLQSNNQLSRSASGDETSYNQIADDGSNSWLLSPALQSDLTLNTGASIPVLIFAKTSYPWGSRTHTVTATLFVRRNSTDINLASDTRSFSVSRNNSGTTPSLLSFDLTSNQTDFLTGDQFGLRIAQSSNWGYQLNVYQASNGVASQVKLTSNTVINVESVALYDAPYPDGSQLTAAQRGQQVYIRATVSDPFGEADISSAALTLKDPANSTILDNIGLTAAAAAGAHKYFDYPYSVASDAAAGTWIAQIQAEEGAENLVSSSNFVKFPVLLYPELVLSRETRVESDPLNGTDTPKALPGAVLSMSLIGINQGEGITDTDTLSIEETLSPDTALFVGDLGNGSPVEFTDGAVSSGLSFSFAGLASATDDIDFSDDGGSTFAYTPDPGTTGYDPAVTNIRFSPKGALNPASGSNQPEFRFHYQVKVQ